MTRLARRGHDSESGVVLVIFAITMVVLLGMIAIAIDGSYGFVQNRRAQNAADFAAFAAAQQLTNSTYCNGTTAPSTHQLALIVQQLVDDNGSGIGSAWTAQFLNGKGQPVLKPNGQPVANFTASSGPTNPPPGACGVSVNATPKWTPFFAGIFGIHKFGGFASAKVSTTAKGSPIGIVALNEYGPHEILGGGTGTFIVEGNIFSNTNVSNPPENQPWTESAGGYQWDDAVDAKSDSNLYVYGTIETNNGLYNGEPLWPLDHCFINTAAPNDGLEAGTPGSGPTDPSQGSPLYNPSCGVGTVTVQYNAISNSYPQESDPLQTSTAPASPLSPVASIGCPGVNNDVPLTYNTITQVPGATTELLPGIYPNPVELTGSVNFQDCSGYDNAGYPDEQAYPGVYDFAGGLWINPAAGDSVTGSNVVIGTQTPYPLAGNVPGSVSGGTFSATGGGNGAPCLPEATQTSAFSGGGSAEDETNQSTPCAGTNSSLYGVVAYNDANEAVDSSIVGTGSNFSLMVGGAAGSSVNLSGPTSGPYAGTDGSPGVVFYQDPGTPANYGFDALTNDQASITVTGVVYNASLAAYGLNAPRDFWDGRAGGIPFYSGGTLQTGFGAGWTSAKGPTPSSGQVTLNGTAIVDDFNTDGNTSITIVGQPYKLPGGGLLSLIG
jgi:hypothetical protein